MLRSRKGNIATDDDLLRNSDGATELGKRRARERTHAAAAQQVRALLLLLLLLRLCLPGRSSSQQG